MVIYRPAEYKDVTRVAEVRIEATEAVKTKHGFASKQSTNEPNPFYGFCLEKEPLGFWVAEADGDIVGMAISWIRGSLWFLSFLFVLPHYQDQNIGQNLLRKVLEYGNKEAIDNRALIAFGFNPGSIGLYIRYGMYPREPIYRMAGAGLAEQCTLCGIELPDIEKLRDIGEIMRLLRPIDEHAPGHIRDRHHEFLASQGASCYLFRKNGVARGYAYLWPDGQIGPVAAISNESLKGVLHAALNMASEQHLKQVSIVVPGCNETAIQIAHRHKLRIVEPYILMSERHFGNRQNYLFHSSWLM